MTTPPAVPRDTERGYVAGFLIVLLLWPGLFSDAVADSWPRLSWWPLLAVGNLLLYVFTNYRLSSPSLSFFASLVAIARSFRSGLVNFTIIYIMPVLLIVYLFAIAHATGAYGPNPPDRWVRFVDRLVGRSWLRGM